VQQIQKRLLDHEMRNLSSKLTPAQRAEKMRRKLQEDTSRQVHVALFRVRNFNDRRHRFKVDVNAQQFNLTGIVLLCSDGGYVLPSGAVSGSNLVVVEGGPKGVRKFVHLMLDRYRTCCRYICSTR
jgi:U4/U6 small nuclear ribonucleoprotein PRP3